MATYESQYVLSNPWAEMWQNPEADATVLLAMLLTKYGEAALDWDPMTLRLEIQDDYHVQPADAVMNKLCALQVVMSSSDFFTRIDAFTNVCNTLADGDPFFEVFAPLELEEIAFALSTVALVRDMLPFSDTVRRYVKRLLKAEGFSSDNFPSIFSVIFDKNPTSRKVRHDVSGIILDPEAATHNAQNIRSMLAEHVGHMLNQFNGLPGISQLDDHILENGLLLSLGTTDASDTEG